MESFTKLRFSKKIDELFSTKLWKDRELEPAASSSLIQKIRNQNYVPIDRTLRKIAEALKKRNVPVEQQELVDLARQQKVEAAGRQEVSSSSRWVEYLESNPLAKNALNLYLERYNGRYGQVKLLGMSEPIPLKEIYTDVQMIDPSVLRKLKTPNELEKAFRQSNSRNFLPKDTSRRDGLELANKTQYLNVLGQPGAGKSTFLRRIGLEALLPAAERKYNHDQIPLFLELKRLKERPLRLAETIRREFASFGFPEGFADVALKNGKLLVLLDGLDEVPVENVNQAVEDIREFVNEYSSNRFITSCRTAFYQTWFARFTDVALADFDHEQIQIFLDHWFRSPADRERKTAEQFWKMLNRSSNMATLELAGRPLLLTFICLFHNETLSLPANRSDLYEGAFRILLDTWASEKRIRNDPICRGLTSKWEILLLEQIAGPAFMENRIFFTESSLINQIDRFLRKDLNSPDLEGKDVLEAIEVDQGLLVKRAHNIYSFSHLTLQEYLTSKYFFNTGKTDDLIVRHFFDQRWREVFLLLVGAGHADNVLLQMAQTVANTISGHKKLVDLLLWINTNYKSSSFGEEQSAARRAIVLFIIRALDPGIKHRKESKAYLESILDLSIELEARFDFKKLFFHAHYLANSSKGLVSRDGAFGFVEELRKNRLLKESLIRAAQKRVKSIKSKIFYDNSNLPYERLSVNSRELKHILLDALAVPCELWTWTRQEAKFLELISYGCKFLIECRKEALSVRDSAWEEILNNLLIVRSPKAE